MRQSGSDARNSWHDFWGSIAFANMADSALVILSEIPMVLAFEMSIFLNLLNFYPMVPLVYLLNWAVTEPRKKTSVFIMTGILY